MSESRAVTAHKDSTRLPSVSLKDLPKRAHPRSISAVTPGHQKTFPRRGGNSEPCHLYSSAKVLRNFSFQKRNNSGNFRVCKKPIAHLISPPTLSPLVSVFLYKEADTGFPYTDLGLGKLFLESAQRTVGYKHMSIRSH